MSPAYKIFGTVWKGKGRGKAMGYPTANISLKNNDEIPEGIYTAKAIIDGKEFIAAAFIGSAKTFGETEIQAESYILDFNEDIYGKEIMIILYKKLRDNIRFSNTEELILQIHRDILAVSAFFRSEL